MDFKDKDPHDYIQGAISFVLWLKIFKKDERLLQEFFQELDNNSEIKKTLQARVREVVQKFEARLLVKEVKEEIQSLFKESKWWRISLLGVQIFGLSAAGMILAWSSELELPKKLSLALDGYIILTLLSVILGILKK